MNNDSDDSVLSKDTLLEEIKQTMSSVLLQEGIIESEKTHSCTD